MPSAEKDVAPCPVCGTPYTLCGHRDEDALTLLAEWYDWWIETPGAPEKMPKALHVRTALLLTRVMPPEERKSDG